VRSRGFNDALFLTSDGMVAEATGSTIFFFRKGEILTPSLDCGILPGITRARLIRLCAENDLPVQELMIPQADLSSYDGAILTGTMVEIRPVSRLEAWHYNPESALHAKLIELLRDYLFRPKAGATAE
jgi:branched-subunit amino acid aminotransferase/4-amino-4-deoxychorismate lyase